MANNLWALGTAFLGKRVVAGMFVDKRAALRFISALLESGELRVVIDRTYPLSDIAAAHRYIDAGHKRGNVVIAVTS
ncbi:zinc-binding dehydrogenase [Lentzea jiangxiensis]|nr:zinc-binding dehydrogenase [Lentzea jiangxiensis]